MKKITAVLLSLVLCMTMLCSCGGGNQHPDSDREQVAALCDLGGRTDLVWTYQPYSDSWLLDPTVSVAYPENAAQQSVSICIPGAYVRGIDTTGDGEADQNSMNTMGSVTGRLLIAADNTVVSSTGMEYTSSNAPVLLMNRSVYGEATDTQTATDSYASEGYIVVSCGNRGNSPEGLVDVKNAVLFVKYNIMNGYLPGSWLEVIASGGLLALCTAATGHHGAYMQAQADAGAYGVYAINDEFQFFTHDGDKTMITDRVWGCLVADPVVSAYNEAMFMALDHELNPYYVYGSEFQHQLDEKLAEMGALSIVDQGIIISEQAINQDLNENGQIDPLIVLLLFRYDDHSAAHNGFYGSLLNYYTYLVNRPKDRPTDEQIAYMQAYLTDQSLAPMVPVTAESGLSYDELVDTWREDLRALYREGEDKVYAYHSLGHITRDDPQSPSWVRFLEDPMTSAHSIMGPLTVTTAWECERTDTDIHFVWDIGISQQDLERKYFPAMIDEMVRTIDITEEALPLKQRVVTAQPAEALAPGEEGVRTIPLEEIYLYDNVQAQDIPLLNAEVQKSRRMILSQDEERTYSDIFLLRALEEAREKLEPLWAQEQE